MNDPKGIRLTDERLVAYAQDELLPPAHREVEEALRHSPVALRRVEQLQKIREALSAPRDATPVDFVDAVRARLDAGAPRTPARRFRPRVFLLAAALASIAAFGLLVLPAHNLESAAEFRPKAAPVDPRDPQRWAGIKLHRLDAAGGLEPITQTLSASDGLMVSYTNLGTRPFAYLMVFGVDAAGQVRWYYPAYQHAGENPTAIPIERRADVLLEDLVEHDYALGPLTIYALFAHRALSVSEVEARLVGSPDDLTQLEENDVSLQPTRVTVVR